MGEGRTRLDKDDNAQLFGAGKKEVAMGDIKIFRASDIESKPLFGERESAGWMKKIIYPPNVDTKCAFMAIAEVSPGYSPHRWHVHTRYNAEDYEVVYPENFEEIYYIVSGKGVIQWKTKDGQGIEENVSASDTILFPAGAPEHQLLNNGFEKIVMVIC